MLLDPRGAEVLVDLVEDLARGIKGDMKDRRSFGPAIASARGDNHRPGDSKQQNGNQPGGAHAIVSSLRSRSAPSAMPDAMSASASRAAQATSSRAVSSCASEMNHAS